MGIGALSKEVKRAEKSYLSGATEGRLERHRCMILSVKEVLIPENAVGGIGRGSGVGGPIGGTVLRQT